MSTATNIDAGKKLLEMAQLWANIAGSDLALIPCGTGFVSCTGRDGTLLACALDLRAAVVNLGLAADLDADVARDFGLEPFGPAAL